MTRTATFTSPSPAIAAVLPMLAFMAGLGTAQFIATGDQFTPQDAAYGDHHRRGARSVLLTDDAAGVVVRVDAQSRRGTRIAVAPDRVVTATYRPVDETRSSRLLSRQ